MQFFIGNTSVTKHLVMIYHLMGAFGGVLDPSLYLQTNFLFLVCRLDLAFE